MLLNDSSNKKETMLKISDCGGSDQARTELEMVSLQSKNDPLETSF